MEDMKVKEQIDDWILSVSLQPNGDLYSHATLISRRLSKSKRIDIYKHCLSKEVATKMALMKMRNGDFAEAAIGQWIGQRHFVVHLTKQEYDELLEKVNGSNTRVKSKRSSKKDPRQIPLDLQNHADDGGIR